MSAISARRAMLPYRQPQTPNEHGWPPQLARTCALHGRHVAGAQLPMCELAWSARPCVKCGAGRTIANNDELQIAAESVEISDWGRFEELFAFTVTDSICKGSGGGVLDPGQSLLAVGMPILRRQVQSVRRCLQGRGCRRHPLVSHLFWGAGADHECIQSILAHDDRRTHPIDLWFMKRPPLA